jgi:hypothetical protein
MRARLWRWAVSAWIVLPAACTLADVTVVDVDDVVIAEIYVEVNRGPGLDNRVTAFLHRTVGGVGPGFSEVPGARVVITRPDGFSAELVEAALEGCVETTPIGGTGTCYLLPPAEGNLLGPGDELQARVSLPGGGVLMGASEVPGDFVLDDLPDGGYCTHPPATPLELRWSQARGAWAYVNETSIRGLAAHFADAALEDGVDDPLYLLGLSISAADTTIVFPGEFGLFNRFELDRIVSLELQEGLPARTAADVSISATDRNYVNWVRGGSFNPSGQVRVPSLVGDGVGVFGTVVVRRFAVAVEPGPGDPGAGTSSCIP